MPKSQTIRIALSSDAKGHPYHATLIASILRRTELPVHVRYYCRGFASESFEAGPLKVEFIATSEEVTGKFPGYVGPAVFDRLRVIRDATDWDRCLIMDYDQLALCDLAPLFEMDLGDHLLAAKMQGPGVDMAHAMRTWVKQPFPNGWDHVAEYPYFSMGPLLNLAAMREAGTWDKLVAAHAAFGVDEQLSLTAATEGRTIGFERKWNLFPKSDIHGELVPNGVIHWLGWPKPWHDGANVWRPDLWESEKSSWEHLRLGLWKKPVAIEVDPEDDRGVRALAKRGWKVKVFNKEVSAIEEIALGSGASYPDVDTSGGTVKEFQDSLRSLNGSIDMVRFGAWADAAKWLDGAGNLPEYLVFSGARDANELAEIHAAGYMKEARLVRSQWPAGGAKPSVLNYVEFQADLDLPADAEIYLRHDGIRRHPIQFSYRPRLRSSVKEPKEIGIMIIATGKTARSAMDLIRSLRRNFLPGHNVTVHLFTDAGLSDAHDLRVIPTSHQSTQEHSSQCYRLYHGYAEKLIGFDYLFHLDADLRIVCKVGEEILADLAAVIHPGYSDKLRETFPYESRTDSTACIPATQGIAYFTEAVQGGRAKNYLEAIAELASRIERDEQRGITARWRAESHWNRYLIDTVPDLTLSPSYCWYPDGRSAGFDPKIAIVLPS